MSLFFLILTVITFLLSHWYSRRTKPMFQLDHKNTNIFQSDFPELSSRIKHWVLSQGHISLDPTNENILVISEKPRFFSFGHFYHFHTSTKSGKTTVQLFIQPKLLSSARHKKALSQKLENEFQLKNVS